MEFKPLAETPSAADPTTTAFEEATGGASFTGASPLADPQASPTTTAAGHSSTLQTTSTVDAPQTLIASTPEIGAPAERLVGLIELWIDLAEENGPKPHQMSFAAYLRSQAAGLAAMIEEALKR